MPPRCCLPAIAAFRLMGAEMYSGMSALQEPTPVIERGMALHKMIRTVTQVCVWGGGVKWVTLCQWAGCEVVTTMERYGS